MVIRGSASNLVKEEIQSDLFDGVAPDLNDTGFLKNRKFRQWRMPEDQHEQDAKPG